MQESKLLKQLKILEKEEFKGLYSFIRSTFFNQSKDVIRLFDYLRKYYPTFDSSKLTKEIVFKKLFPQQVYSDIKLRNLRTKASKLVEQYLINITFQQDDFERKKLITQIYGKRNYYPAFEKNTQQLLDTLEKQPYRDACYFYDKYLLQKDFYLHVATAKKEQTVNILKDALLNLTHYLTLEQQFLSIDLVNRDAIFSGENQFTMTKFSNDLLNGNLLFQLFQGIFTLHQQPTETNFKRLRQLYIDNINQIRPIYSKEIFFFLTNHVIRQFKFKEKLYVPILFQFYEIGLQKKLLFEKGKIEPATFYNIVSLSSKLKRFIWAEQFIQEYQFQMATSYPENTIQLSKSYLRFHQEKYEEVISILSISRFRNPFYQLNAKTLLLRTYYKLFEQDHTYYNLLIAQCNAFIKFLQRNQQLNEKKKQATLLFSKLIKSLAETQYGNKFDEIKRQNLFQEIQDSRGLTLKGWLLETLNNLPSS